MAKQAIYLRLSLLAGLALTVAGLANAAEISIAGRSHPQPQTTDSGAIGGGIDNQAGEQATVGGGYHNQATGFRATISGGANNLANNGSVVIGGGEWNRAIYSYATICGGTVNTASALNATIGGGSGNLASGPQATVGGGTRNTSSGVQTTVGGGVRNTANAAYATVGGGLENLASGRRAAVGGGAGNIASGEDATIAGGLSNQATDRYSTVGGGRGNQAGNLNDDVEDARYATISGGQDNRALNLGAAVGGGVDNHAGGIFATVPGGVANRAGGDYSFAAGRRAQIEANHPGAILLADSNDVDFNSAAANEFAVRATGGMRLIMAIDAAGAAEAGVRLAAGSGSWQSLSSRAAKTNVEPIDPQEVLVRLQTVPITTWNYRAQEPSIRHIGPMAEDFRQAFGLGEDERYLNSVDVDGVALAAIQGLYQLAQQQAVQIAALEQQLAVLTRACVVNQAAEEGPAQAQTSPSDQ